MLEQANGGQAPEASIDSRIESVLFGSPPLKKPQQAPQPEEQQAPEPESSEVPEGEQQAPIEETFELEVDGERIAIPKKFEKAVMQQRDYTQKTMTLAEKERNFEFLHEQARVANFRAEFEREANPEIQKLQAYDAVLNQPVDWQSMSTEEAFRKKIQLDEWRKEREDVAMQLRNKHGEWARKTEQALKDLQAKGTEVISKRVPNWSEDTWKAITSHAKNDGYTEAELSQIIDPRHKVTLWKAKQYDELRAKATKTVADVKAVKTTPTNPMPAQTKDYLNFRKTVTKTAPNSPERKQAVEARIGAIFAKR